MVAEERDITYEKADQLANGQVYSGMQAKKNGLIDILGTFEDAIHIASKKAGYVDIPEIVYPPKEKKGLLNVLFGDIFQNSTLDNLLMYPKPEYILSYPIK